MAKYELVEKKGNQLNTFIVTIVGDSNDADYVTETEHFDKKEFEKILDELINLRDNYGKDHKLKSYPNPMELSIPFNGWDGYCHSLESLDVEYIDSEGKIFEVKF